MLEIRLIINLHPDNARLVKNFIWLISLRGLDFLIPLLTIPYLLRTIGVERFGIIGFGYAFAAYFGAIVQYGFNVTATRDIARSRNNCKEVGRIYSTVLLTSTVLMVLTVGVAILVMLGFPKLRSDVPLYTLCLAQCMAQSLFPNWFFQGMERMAFITYSNLAAKVAFIVGLLVLVDEPSDYLYVPLLNAASASMVLVSSLWIVWRVFRVELMFPGWSAVREALADGRHSFVNQLAPNLYNNSSTFLLGIFSGGYAVGLYTAATKVVDAISSLGYILSSTFLPYLSRSLENHRVFKRIMLSAGLGATFFILFAADFIGRLLHHDDGPAIANLLRWASVGTFLIFTMLTYGTNYLMLRNREATVGRISLYTSVLFFLVALALVPVYGAVGCIITIVGARGSMAALLYLSYRRLDAARH